MTTATATTPLTKKQELIEVLKNKAEYRDAMYDEIARHPHRRDQWYTDRRRLYDAYQAQCDQLAEQIFELSNQEMDEMGRIQKQIDEVKKCIAGLQAELDKAWKRACELNTRDVLFYSDWYQDRLQLVEAKQEDLADLERQFEAI